MSIPSNALTVAIDRDRLYFAFFSESLDMVGLMGASPMVSNQLSMDQDKNLSMMRDVRSALQRRSNIVLQIDSKRISTLD
mmetsp:Transcript_12155/g.23513  ORF Transcript_12155/g.23513 Transcript_12155/m.23513 type:complete len:80 (-) Transcript_12155:209-448(-)